MKVKLNYKRKKIEFEVDRAEGIKKFTGLMLKKPNTNALLFEFENETRQAIHSFFCPDFLALWLDKNNKIIEYKLILGNKLSVRPKKKFTKLLEIPLNKKYSTLVNFFITSKEKPTIN